jgi:putative ABC transport system substrate-binding protein
MYKKIIGLIFFLLGVFAGITFLVINKTQKTKKYTVAIIQTASHLALDRVKDACVKKLEQLYTIDDIDVIVKNGQGNIDNLQIISKQISLDNTISLCVAIGTPALQAMAAIEKNKPIVFAAVTNPYLFGIADQYNICGITDQIDYDAVIASLIMLCKDKKIGILYSIGDPSSEYTIKKLEASQVAMQSQLMKFGCLGEAELLSIINLACQSVDMLFIPTDNTIASAINIVIAVAKKYNIPLFMTDQILFSLGGTYVQGVDYVAQGMQIADIISQLLEKKMTPDQAGIKNAPSSDLIT